MKKFLRAVALVCVLLLLSFVIFYNWASSGNLNEKEYAKIILPSEKPEIPTPRDSIYSIMTYNIGYLSGMTNNKAVEKPKSLFDNNLKKVQEEIKKLNPDIIAFQEIDYDASRSHNINQQTEIAKLDYNYIAQAVNWDEKYVPFPYFPVSTHFGKVISGQSIISKYPITEQERVVLERDQTTWFFTDAFYLERLVQVAKININNQDVIVLNTHLDAFNYNLRMSQLKATINLFNKYKKDYPAILLGDFNSDPNYENPAIDLLLNDATLGNASFTRDDYELSFNTDKPFERLDFIFYEKDEIELVSAKVVTSFGQASDHFPVFMKFKLK